MKKAQLTMFIILGIVLMSIFGFVFFTTTQIERKKAEQQADKIIGELLQTTSLKFLVRQCSEKALEKGIDLLAKQGGRFYQTQLPSLYEQQKVYFMEENEKEYLISYGILKADIPVPQYPCRIGFEDYNQPPAFCAWYIAPKFKYMDFGIINLPPLCKNRYGGCSIREGWNQKFSAQMQLENYISNYVNNCVNFSSILGINQSFEVNKGNISTNITFSDNDVIALIDFPIIVTPPASQPILKIVKFESTMQTKFKQLYGIARDLIVKNVNSPDSPMSKLTDEFQNIINTKYSTNPGFNLVRKKDVSAYDDLIKLIDISVTAGRELIVQFLIENRPPILEYIYPPGPKGKALPDGCGVYDLIQIEGTKLSLNPLAYDTEEDELTFKYSGWFENYNETVTPLTFNEKGCPLSFEKRLTPLTQQNKRWKSDSDFETTGKAEAMLTKTDIGPHEFTITVCDEQYCDNQTIRVLIDDLIEITLEKKNPFSTQIFSIEDPYTVNASIKDIYDAGLYLFSWLIKDNENVIYRTDSLQQKLILPVEEYSIENIVDKYESLFDASKETILTKTYTVVGQVIQSEQEEYTTSDETTINAEVCSDYQGIDNPYPYNTGDPFMAKHACCITDAEGKLSTNTNQECYESTTYGSFLSFDSEKYIKSYDISTNTIFPTPLFIGFSIDLGGNPILKMQIDFTNEGTIYSNSNDIIKREFTRKCDGSRGNICGGEIVETYSVKACEDKKLGEIRTCFGPSVNYLEPKTETSNELSCVSFSGSNFERQLDLTNDRTCNANSKCTAREDDLIGYDDAVIAQDAANNLELRYFCNATCGTTGCTRTLPELCADCYDGQTCQGPTISNYKTDAPITIYYEKFNGCFNSLGCSKTGLTPSTSTCSGDILSFKLCSLDPTEGEPFIAGTVNCALKNETAAKRKDNSCIYLEKSICDGSYCKLPATQSILYDYPYEISEDNFVYRRAEPKHIWGILNIEESCDFVNVDFDTLDSSYCTLVGTWTGTKCCGDDYGEIWTGTSCSI